MKSLKEIENKIFKLRGGGSKFSTEPMSNFATKLGSPQSALKIVHIAGTNGKGSTSAFVESILRAHSNKVGLFTSPHLLKINERIQINRKEISDEDFVEIFETLENVAEKIKAETPHLAPTFFEYITSLALSYFKREKTDWSVLEVGLGGRLDATNIVNPKICVITSIGFDHMQFLGNTLAEIASEKAGIIKENTPVVCGILPNEAMQEIEKIAKQKNAPLYKLEDFYTENPIFETSMSAHYQAKNAALAFLTCEILGKMGELDFSEAIAKDAILETFWAARWQKIELKNDATLILDCSHNAEGANELDKNLATLLEKNGGQKPIIACGILGEERAIPLLKVISKYAKKIVFLRPNEDRALSFDELQSCLPKDVNIETENSEVEKLFGKNSCSLVKNGETIVCTGSCYLAGEVLSILSGKNKDNLQDILPKKNS